MSVTVAPLDEADLDEVLEIEVAQFDDPWSRQVLTDELSDPSRRYTKAVGDGRLVGYLGMMVVRSEAEAHVNTLATAPGSEGAGVATALLVEGLAAVVADGVHDVTLEVASRNLRAQRLYTRFGFAPVGVRRRYYVRSGDDAIVMWVRDVHTDAYARRLGELGGGHVHQ